MKIRRLLTAGIAVGALALAGCSTNDSSAPKADSTEASSGTSTRFKPVRRATSAANSAPHPP